MRRILNWEPPERLAIHILSNVPGMCVLHCHSSSCMRLAHGTVPSGCAFTRFVRPYLRVSGRENCTPLAIYVRFPHGVNNAGRNCAYRAPYVYPGRTVVERIAVESWPARRAVQRARYRYIRWFSYDRNSNRRTLNSQQCIHTHCSKGSPEVYRSNNIQSDEEPTPCFQAVHAHRRRWRACRGSCSRCLSAFSGRSRC